MKIIYLLCSFILSGRQLQGSISSLILSTISNLLQGLDGNNPGAERMVLEGTFCFFLRDRLGGQVAEEVNDP